MEIKNMYTCMHKNNFHYNIDHGIIKGSVMKDHCTNAGKSRSKNGKHGGKYADYHRWCRKDGLCRSKQPD